MFLVADLEFNNLTIALLPLCEEKIQIEFVNNHFQNYAYEHQRILEKTQLQLSVWEEASKLNPSMEYSSSRIMSFTTEVTAHIINGQIGNHQFLCDFFRDLFEDKKKLDQQKAFLEHLKAEVFAFEKPEDVKHMLWYQFFKALRENARSATCQGIAHPGDHASL